MSSIININYICRYIKYHLIDKRSARRRYYQKIEKRVRLKSVIKVAFIVYDISKWKSEALFVKMQKHPRFDPIIVVVVAYTGNYSLVLEKYTNCLSYIKNKNYHFVSGQRGIDIGTLVNADIVFYGEGYGLFDSDYNYSYLSNRNLLSCYVPYCFTTLCDPVLNNLPQNNLLWKSFEQTPSIISELKDVMYNKGRNLIYTGLPIQDSFIEAMTRCKDNVWKKQNTPKFKIIWAPSHTIPIGGKIFAYESSNFTRIAEEMILLAEKYKDSVQWAFKPHPALKSKLYKVWGVDKTETYYAQWKNSDYTQLEEGQYIDLFMTSDAMIHDCLSFIMEYMYAGKPVLFIDNGKGTAKTLNKITRDAYNLHYKGSSMNDVIDFIENRVLKSNDELLPARVAFYSTHLVPPHGKSASQNIINSILGEGEYKM